MKFLIFGLLILTSNGHARSPDLLGMGAAYVRLPAAKKGGIVYSRLMGNPKVLNPIVTDDVESSNVTQYIFAKLMQLDHETGEYFPYLAEKLEVSKDRKVMTYTLRKNATWQDGTPVTTEDVAFTYQKFWDPKVDAAPVRAFVGPFNLEVVDQRVFRLSVVTPNVNTLGILNDNFVMVQKKQYADVKDFNRAKALIDPVGNGPYRLKNFSRDQRIELERVKGWWGESVPQFRNLFNFDGITYRIIPDNALAYEKFMKGEINVLEMNSETYGMRVRGSDQDKFGTMPGKKRVWANHFRTQAPAPYTYIGWNLRKAMFSSKKTRQALAMLVDYDQIIKKVYFDEGARCVSPFGSYTPNTAADQKSKAFQYNPSKALVMLRADGWADTDQDGVIEKVIGGKRVKFEFTLRYNSENPMRSKIAQMVKESFKKAGISVSVQAMEWNSYIAEIENRNFDAYVLGWGKGSIHPDANQLWHTKSYENKGSNHVGYSNAEVDALIADSLKELDVQKRHRILQKIGALIYDDQPYAFVVEVPGFIMAVDSTIQSPRWSMKYDDTPPMWLFSSKQ